MNMERVTFLMSTFKGFDHPYCCAGMLGLRNVEGATRRLLGLDGDSECAGLVAEVGPTTG